MATTDTGPRRRAAGRRLGACTRGLAWAAATLFTAAPAVAADAVVAGSHIDRFSAERAVGQIASRTGLAAVIAEADVHGTRWHRVIVTGDDGAATLAQLRDAGFTDAWRLPPSGAAPTAARITATAPAIARAPLAAASTATPAPSPGTGSATAAAPVATPDRVAAPGPVPSTTVATAATVAAALPSAAPVATPASRPPVAGRADPRRRAAGSGHGSERLLNTLDGIPIEEIEIQRMPDADVDITLDGVPDEPEWARVPWFDNMIVSVPGTGDPARHPSEVRMFATESGLYVSAIMYQPVDSLVSRLSVRDDYIDRDTFGVTLDTTGEGKFAYWFILGLGDSMMDGKVLPERNYQRDWDGTWVGKSARRDDGWSAEIFFPWSMMALPNRAGPRTIGFAVSRQVASDNERYQWPGHAYASAQFVTALNHLVVDNVEPRKQYSVIPYATSTADRAHHTNELRVGADVTWKPSPALEMTASVLPDFGSVEADDVVVNVTAQEAFFPEKRLFFLEGNEVFETHPRANPGNQLRFTTNENYATTSRKVFLNTFVPAPISLLNTRRIGGVPTQLDLNPGETLQRGERDLQTQLFGAAKVTGTSGPLRYGVLAASEEDVELLARDGAGNRVHVGDPGRDFGIARVQWEQNDGDRRAVGYMGTHVAGPRYDATVHGVDAHYTNGDGSVIVDALTMMSDVDDVVGYGAQVDLQYAPSKSMQHRFNVDWFDEDVNFNDLGFLARNDYVSAQYLLSHANDRGIGRFADIRSTLILRRDYNVSEGHPVDGGIFLRNSVVMPGRNTLRTGIGFRPHAFEDRDSRGNGAYRTDDRWWTEMILATDASAEFSYSFTAGAQQENLGDWTWLYGAGVTWRPNDRVSLDLDARYRDRHGWIVYQGGRNFGRYAAGDLQPAIKFNWFIAAEHQLRLTLQWAGVRAREKGFFAVPAGDGDLVPTARTLPDHDFTLSLFTMQLRYRWEIAPLTDLYIVYNRGNTVPNLVDEDFDDLLDAAFSDPLIDSVVAKLRWRFGN